MSRVLLSILMVTHWQSLVSLALANLEGRLVQDGVVNSRWEGLAALLRESQRKIRQRPLTADAWVRFAPLD